MSGMTVAGLRAWGRVELKAVASDPSSGVESATVFLDVDLLLQNAFGFKDRVQLIIKDKQVASSFEQQTFTSFIERRKLSEPIAYILGLKEFRSLEFEVDSSVLIPRPETEILVEAALSHFKMKPESFFVLDIGAGSGAICLSLLSEIREMHGEEYFKQGSVIASDISPRALEVARKNAKKFGLENYLQFVQSDLLNEVELESQASLKLFLSNPPYISPSEQLLKNVLDHEPSLALFAENEGLEIIERIIESLSSELKSGSKLILEIGANQSARVESALLNLGIETWTWHCDLAGLRRVVEI